MTKPSGPQREFYVSQESTSNRALIREHGEKWPDDINCKPNPDKWFLVIKKAALTEALAERDKALALLVARPNISKREAEELISARDAALAEVERLKSELKAKVSLEVVFTATAYEDQVSAQAVEIEQLKLKAGDNEKFLASDDCYYWAPESSAKLTSATKLIDELADALDETKVHLYNCSGDQEDTIFDRVRAALTRVIDWKNGCGR